jgi:hypothetical protein
MLLINIPLPWLSISRLVVAFLLGYGRKFMAAPQGSTMQDKIYTIEDLTVDENAFLPAITPGGFFFDGNESIGEQTTAEFHDIITADVEAETGYVIILSKKRFDGVC